MKLFIASLLVLICNILPAQNVLFNTSGGTPDASALMELRSTDKGFLPPRMNEAQRLGIGSPAQGLTVFQTNGLIGYYFYNGIAWDTLGGASIVNNFSSVTNISSSGIVVLRDEKPNGVDGGDFTGGIWQTRELNAKSGDTSFITLVNNAFTLDSGVYVITASVPTYRINNHQSRLYNVTGGVTSAVGSVEYPANFASSTSFITAIIEVTNALGNTFEIQHRCSSGRVNDGLGIGSSWTDNVYTQVKIEKL